MDGKRRRWPQMPGHLVAALSGVALFAFACFPVLAYAGAIEGEYQDAPPTAEGKPLTPGNAKPPRKEPVGTASTVNPNPGSNGAESSGETESPQAGGVAGNKPGSHNGAQHNGKAGESKRPSAQPGKVSVDPVSSDGGSSPVLPIILGILALAAASVAAFLIRQRRQQASGQSVSPRAG